QLARFEQMQAYRRTLVERYRDALKSIDGLGFVPGKLDEAGADHLMVIVLPEGVDRARVVAELGAAGIGTSVHFRPLHNFEWFRTNATVGRLGTPVADSLAGRVLSLPLHSALTFADVDRV